MRKQAWFSHFHHYYIGLFLLMIAFILLGYSFIITSLIVFILGLWILIDDYWQHFIQTTRDKNYHSLLHKLYGYIYSRSKLIRWLNEMADRLFE